MNYNLYNYKTRNELINLTILYFKYRNLYNYGFQRYSFFRNLISHITNISDPYPIRSIFNNMINRKQYEIKKEQGKIYYRFNPLRKIEIKDNNPIILFFD